MEGVNFAPGEIDSRNFSTVDSGLPNSHEEGPIFDIDGEETRHNATQEIKSSSPDQKQILEEISAKYGGEKDEWQISETTFDTTGKIDTSGEIWFKNLKGKYEKTSDYYSRADYQKIVSSLEATNLHFTEHVDEKQEKVHVVVMQKVGEEIQLHTFWKSLKVKATEDTLPQLDLGSSDSDLDMGDYDDEPISISGVSLVSSSNTEKNTALGINEVQVTKKVDSLTNFFSEKKQEATLSSNQIFDTAVTTSPLTESATSEPREQNPLEIFSLIPQPEAIQISDEENLYKQVLDSNADSLTAFQTSLTALKKAVGDAEKNSAQVLTEAQNPLPKTEFVPTGISLEDPAEKEPQKPSTIKTEIFLRPDLVQVSARDTQKIDTVLTTPKESEIISDLETQKTTSKAEITPLESLTKIATGPKVEPGQTNIIVEENANEISLVSNDTEQIQTTYESLPSESLNTKVQSIGEAITLTTNGLETSGNSQELPTSTIIEPIKTITDDLAETNRQNIKATEVQIVTASESGINEVSDIPKPAKAEAQVDTKIADKQDKPVEVKAQMGKTQARTVTEPILLKKQTPEKALQPKTLDTPELPITILETLPKEQIGEIDNQPTALQAPIKTPVPQRRTAQTKTRVEPVRITLPINPGSQRNTQRINSIERDRKVKPGSPNNVVSITTNNSTYRRGTNYSEQVQSTTGISLTSQVDELLADQRMQTPIFELAA